MMIPGLARENDGKIKYKHVAVMPSTVELLYKYKDLGETWDHFLRQMLEEAIFNHEQEMKHKEEFESEDIE